MEKVALLDLAREELIATFEQRLKLLIVGGRSTNLSDEMRADERIEVLDSTDAASMSATDIPQRVGVVFLSPFIAHSLSNRLRCAAASKGISMFGPFSTGELRNLYTSSLADLEQATHESPREHSSNDSLIVDYSGLAGAILDCLAPEELSENLLEDEVFLRNLSKRLSSTWPSLSVKRTRRALKRCLTILGIVKPVQVVDDSRELQEQQCGETADTSALKRRVAELESELRAATQRSNALHGQSSKLIGKLKSERQKRKLVSRELIEAQTAARDGCVVITEILEVLPELAHFLTKKGIEALARLTSFSH